MAARPDSRADSGGFLLSVKPDIVPQMKALVRLVLDMKLARDALDERAVLPANAGANFDSEMATLAGDEASIIVLLADGFDPANVRAIFKQARSHGLTEGLQWFLPDTAALDHIFDLQDNNRDEVLAHDMHLASGNALP